MTKQNKWWLGLALGVFTIIGISNLSFANRSWRSFESWAGNDVPTEYRLTQEQVQEIESVQSGYQDQILPLEQKMAAKFVEMESEWSKSNSDPERIRDIRREVRDLEDQIEDIQIQTGSMASKILTPEQQSYFGNPLDLFDGTNWSCRWDGENDASHMNMRGSCKMGKHHGSMMGKSHCSRESGSWSTGGKKRGRGCCP